MPQQKNSMPILRLIRTIPAERNKPLHVLPGLHGTLFVAHGGDIRVQPLQSAHSASPRRPGKGPHAPVVGWALSRDGSRIASLDSHCSFVLSEAASGRTLHRIAIALPPIETKENTLVSPLALSPDGRYVGIDHPTRHFCIADLRSGKVVFAPAGAAGGIFSPDGKTLVTGGMWWLRTWTVGSWRRVRQVNIGDAYTTPAAFTPNGKTLFTVIQWFKAQQSAVQQRGADSLAEQALFSSTGGDITFGSVADTALSPDGRWLAVAIGGLADGSVPTLTLWDVRTRQEARLPRLTVPTSAVRFSPDGRFLVSVSRDAARLWELVRPSASAHENGH